MVRTPFLYLDERSNTDECLVYCVDRLPEPAEEFYETKERVGQFGGSIHYRQVDVSDTASLDASIAEIAAEHKRLDGLIAAAGIQHVSDAVDYPPDKVDEVRFSETSK